MRITIGDMLGMLLRKSPVGRIRRALRAADEAGLSLTPAQIEAHALAGGHIEATVAALARARQAEVEASWNTVCAIDLPGRDVEAAVEEAARSHTAEFGTIAHDSDEPIEGNCADGSPVRVSFHVEYRPPLGVVVFGDPGHFPLQEALALRALRRVAEAASLRHLRTLQDRHAEQLRTFADARMPGVHHLRVDFNQP